MAQLLPQEEALALTVQPEEVLALMMRPKEVALQLPLEEEVAVALVLALKLVEPQARLVQQQRKNDGRHIKGDAASDRRNGRRWRRGV